jgi:hypothetical protein
VLLTGGRLFSFDINLSGLLPGTMARSMGP